MELEPIIGLEIHVQLKTKSKMFCACDNTGEDQAPNTTICPICTGHPGTLPVPNKVAIAMASQAALALHLKVNSHSKFDRKNYFYPDLPKGYQISQYDEPLASEGYLEIVVAKETIRIGIERLHLEEDTAKLLHGQGKTLVDFNRAGTPLMEIVTKPDIKTPEQARVFLQELRLILRYLEVSDADMEKGHLRCDANISLRPKGEDKFYTKTEIKNMNSFKSVEKALAYEINRQTDLWQHNNPPIKTVTRGWDDKKGITVEQREKEAVNDYRYFPEPDIPPLNINPEEIQNWQVSLPELPANRRWRLQTDYGLALAEAQLLTDDKELGDYVQRVVKSLSNELEGELKAAAKLAVNWILHKLTPIMLAAGLTIDKLPFSLSQMTEFLLLVSRRQVNSTNAQLLLKTMVETGKPPVAILEDNDLAQSSSSDGLIEIIKTVVSQYPDQVAQFKAGKDPVIKFLLGAVMKQAKGKADPLEAENNLREFLK
ncbi:Asp-tRNA(Asn)/Glu-tRNA(Gln) amidotransferase subunit GatB [Patescibacteria group bacterium]|nr:Asp-tRNA(Asn)/Glu-tRNA(Gln) amidotransferase subunit GatB [Patescibacteria group bacterium]